MTVGRGLINIDDYIRFGKLVDKLSEHCYIVMYIPKDDTILISFHKDKYDKVKEILGDKIIKTKKNNALMFVRARWR